MDPLTQGALGAAFPEAVRWHKKSVAIAGFLGFFSGMAPDLDILIRSEIDTLLYIEYHRQFTHSLVFMPFGGLICASLFHVILGKRWALRFWQTALCCTLGLATHAFLDAATSYGTQLFWPFSDYRVAWNLISVIDPAFTLPLLAGVIIAAIRNSVVPVRLALAWCALYLVFGFTQQQTATGMIHELARSRGHQVEQLTVKPSFGNLFLWKSIYRSGNTFYVDAIRPRFDPTILQGESVVELDIARDLPWLDRDSQQARDIERFRHFSSDYLAMHPDGPMRVIDVRYSLLPNQIAPLWSIRLDPAASTEAHAVFRTHRGDSGERLGRLWGLITRPGS